MFTSFVVTADRQISRVAAGFTPSLRSTTRIQGLAALKKFFNKVFHRRNAPDAKIRKPRKPWAFAASDRYGRNCGDGADMGAAGFSVKSEAKSFLIFEKSFSAQISVEKILLARAGGRKAFFPFAAENTLNADCQSDA